MVSTPTRPSGIVSTPDNLLARRVPPTKKYIKYLAQCTYPTRRAPSTASTPDWKVPAQWELPIGKYLARWVSPIRKYLARCVPPTRDVAVPCTPEPWELVLDHRTEGWASRRVRRGINQHDLPVKRKLSSKFTLYLYVTKPGMKRTTKRKIFFEKIKYKQWYWTTSVVILHLKNLKPEDLRLTLGCPLLMQSHSSLGNTVLIHGKMLLVRRKLSLVYWPISEICTERTSAYSGWAFCAVNLEAVQWNGP
jgi:hypothetical protein